MDLWDSGTSDQVGEGKRPEKKGRRTELTALTFFPILQAGIYKCDGQANQNWTLHSNGTLSNGMHPGQALATRSSREKNSKDSLLAVSPPFHL